MTPTSAAAPEGIGLRAFSDLVVLTSAGSGPGAVRPDNPGEVCYPADRPYGLIEAAVIREDAPDPGLAWSAGLA